MVGFPAAPVVVVLLPPPSSSMARRMNTAATIMATAPRIASARFTTGSLLRGFLGVGDVARGQRAQLIVGWVLHVDDPTRLSGHALLEQVAREPTVPEALRARHRFEAHEQLLLRVAVEHVLPLRAELPE